MYTMDSPYLQISGNAMPDTAKKSHRTRNARLELRLPRNQKSYFQRAATLAGQTRREFVIDSTQKAAAKAVQEHELIRLSRVQQIDFVLALLSPSEPGVRLGRAAVDYRKKSGL